jgi:NADH:ubiquinone oxidoreductase subunit E
MYQYNILEEQNMKVLIIEVCMGTACHLMGAQALIDIIENLPEDKRARVDFRGATCLKSCRQGPTVKVNGVVLANMTPDRLQAVIEDNLI